MKKIDLNCDLGESFGNYKCGMDEEVIPFITSANVACGFHASDPVVMQKTVKTAKEYQVCVGAHPGYQDLVGFGRRNMVLQPAEITAIVQYQIGALSAFCTAAGITLQHVKPHGALYNMAVKDEKIAAAICEGIASIDQHLIGLSLHRPTPQRRTVHRRRGDMAFGHIRIGAPDGGIHRRRRLSR